MATDRLPPRIARIKHAIESKLDFTGLRDGGEEAVVQFYRPRGQNGRAVICEWQAVGMRAQERRQGAGVTVSQRAAVDLASSDLDYWPEDWVGPDDGDEDEELESLTYEYQIEGE